MLLLLNETDPTLGRQEELSSVLECIWEEIDQQKQSRNLEFLALLQEHVEAADRELHESGDATISLGKIRALYNSGGALLLLRKEWAGRKHHFSQQSWKTGAWHELQKALAASESGKFEAVARWAAQMETKFLGIYESYESLRLMNHEITAETSLCHEYLREGVECWLEALQLLAEGVDNREGVESLAEQGQRAFLVVKTFDRELKCQLLVNRRAA